MRTFLSVLVNSRREEYQNTGQAFFSAFKHFGLPYKVVDLAAGDPDPEEIFKFCVS
ncbi:MAG: hypothetical protein DDT31_01105 [Syntrophomonadaceae bacterium]|nr:hypothetical protein [Bacillota bacterium]